MDPLLIKKIERIKTFKRPIKELVFHALKQDYVLRELKIYVVDVISYSNHSPIFKQFFGAYYNALEAVRDIAEREKIEDIENSEDPNDSRKGILRVSRVHGAEKIFTEKDMLNSWKILLEHVEMRTEIIDEREVHLDNKYLVLDALTDKYNIRKNNYLSNMYNKRNNKSEG